jgi:disulfide bond formation protein DsbB
VLRESFFYHGELPVTRETFQLFFAILTLVSLTGVGVLLVARLLAPRVPAMAGVLDGFATIALPLAWLVALTATLGSLYFSEVANFEPCTLCWYQRIAMYPLAVILGIAALRKDRRVWIYGVPLAGIGAAIAGYHYLVERFPDLDQGACSATLPCTFVWFEELGFVTLPFMALAGFLFIIALLTLPTREA